MNSYDFYAQEFGGDSMFFMKNPFEKEKNLFSDYHMRKLSDHAYSIMFDTLNESAAEKYEFKNFKPFACSSVRNGNFYGRNFDWFYSNEVDFICRIAASKDRYASINVCSGISSLTKDVVERYEYSYLYDVIPYMAVDGINECGLVANINVVPQGVKTTGTNPGKKRIPLMFIVRYILDNCKDAEEAVTKIKNEVDCYSPDIRGLGYKIHIMLSDGKHDFIVEFIENECKIIKCGEFDTAIVPDYTTKYPIMTNFYLWNTTKEDGTLDPYKLTPHSSGYERYNLTVGNYDTLGTFDNMFNHMTDTLKYTKAYTNELGNDFWFSEFVGMKKSADSSELLTMADVLAEDKIERFRYADGLIKAAYEDKSRDEQKIWCTTHSSVYDMKNKTLTVQIQEGEEIDNLTFGFNEDLDYARNKNFTPGRDTDM